MKGRTLRNGLILTPAAPGSDHHSKLLSSGHSQDFPVIKVREWWQLGSLIRLVCQLWGCLGAIPDYSDITVLQYFSLYIDFEAVRLRIRTKSSKRDDLGWSVGGALPVAKQS